MVVWMIEVLEYWLSLCDSGHSKLSRYWRQFQQVMLEVCGFVVRQGHECRNV